MRQLDRNAPDLWVFAYGSLLWNPGFRHVERHTARIRGYHRSLCVYSHVHRGTPERPGLVLGLDRGGACRGLAYRVCAAEREPTLDYLRAREQVTAVYQERRLAAELEDGRIVDAIAYVVDRRHPQYSGRLPIGAVVERVMAGSGRSGANVDYVLNSQAHLRDMGVRDRLLDELAVILRENVSSRPR